MERKGASYKITEKRAASSHAEHTQRTNATVASEMYGGEKRPSGPGAFGQGPRLEKKYHSSGRQYYEAQPD